MSFVLSQVRTCKMMSSNSTIHSMIAVHPFTTSRETVLQMWSTSAQARRQAPDAGLTDLFLLLQGMIFTNIQLDDFKSVLARFEEKLMLEGSYSNLSLHRTDSTRSCIGRVHDADHLIYFHLQVLTSKIKIGS